jgi:hypothetical protein
MKPQQMIFEDENKPRNRRGAGLFKPSARSRVTNGRELLPGVDGRSLWVRSFRDVPSLHLSDLGGADNVSEAEKAIARRAACLIVELEQLEVKFAMAGEAKGWQIDRYQRLANTLRRLLEAWGLQRRPKDVTPTLQEYLGSPTGDEKPNSGVGARRVAQIATARPSFPRPPVLEGSKRLSRGGNMCLFRPGGAGARWIYWRKLAAAAKNSGSGRARCRDSLPCRLRKTVIARVWLPVFSPLIARFELANRVEGSRHGNQFP